MAWITYDSTPDDELDDRLVVSLFLQFCSSYVRATYKQSTMDYYLGLQKTMPDLRSQPGRAIIKTVGLTWHNPNSLTVEGCEIRIKPVASGRSSSTPVSRLKRLPGRESSASGQKLAEDRQQDVALGVGGIQRRHHAPQLSLGGPRCQARRQSTKSRLDGGNVRDFSVVEVSDPGPNGPARGNASRLTPAWA